MLKKVDVPQTPFGSEDQEYYKSLARLAERRARDIRRIAALDRDQLEKRAIVDKEAASEKVYAAERERLRRTCARLQNDLNKTRAELKELRKIHKNLMNSRAHALADAYVRYAGGSSVFAWAMKPIRAVVLLLFGRRN